MKTLITLILLLTSFFGYAQSLRSPYPDRKYAYHELQVGVNGCVYKNGDIPFRLQLTSTHFIGLGSRVEIPVRVSALFPIKNYKIEATRYWGQTGLGIRGDSLMTICWFPVQYREIFGYKGIHLVPISIYFKYQLPETNRIIIEFGLTGYSQGAEVSARFVYVLLRSHHKKAMGMSKIFESI